jgi:hypothetical protein
MKGISVEMARCRRGPVSLGKEGKPRKQRQEYYCKGEQNEMMFQYRCELAAAAMQMPSYRMVRSGTGISILHELGATIILTVQ